MENFVTEYTWTTDSPHYDNSETMQDFMDNHLGEAFEGDFKVIYQEDSYAEVEDEYGIIRELYASGNGDSNNHTIRIR